MNKSQYLTAKVFVNKLLHIKGFPINKKIHGNRLA